MTQLIQIADDQNTDTNIVRLVAKGDDDLIPLFTYLISESEPNLFFLQVATSNRNLSRFAAGPFDTISLSQMLALIEDTGYAKDAIVANITYYDATVQAILDTEGKPETPFIRPTTGAISRLATSVEITRCLELPRADDERRIGRLARSGEAEVTICPDERILNHHILVAGSTGSGKSHLLSNLSHAAAAMGRCIILFDHKPDHQNHHEENLEADDRFRQAFSLNGEDTNRPAVRYWTLDTHDPNTHAQVLSVKAEELNPEILAGTVFYRPNEDNQAEIFAHLATNFADDRADRQRNWTIQELITHITGNNDGALGNLLYGQDGGRLNKSTMDALRRKVRLPGRIPSFIDTQPPPGPTGTRRPTGNITDLFRQPGLNVIRVSESNNRGYALFLSYLLEEAARIRAVSLQAETNVPDLEVIIDEASDIFRAESRQLRDAATGMLAEQIRKGRSLHVGYVVSVQSAGDVPEGIRNNLNTTIVGRHRNMNILREALPTARPEMLEQADKLNPGEMFVDLFGSRSLLLVQMDQSRSNLTVAD